MKGKLTFLPLNRSETSVYIRRNTPFTVTMFQMIWKDN